MWAYVIEPPTAPLYALSRCKRGLLLTNYTPFGSTGYGARVPLHANPWNKAAFETQIVAIILAPTLICVSVYLTLKHVCLALNPALSRVRPHLYPFIFVPADVSCLLLQAIGGGLAASAGQTNFTLLQHGNRVIIAGISLQVVVLLFFGLTAGDYALRMKKWIASSDPEGRDSDQRAAVELWGNKRFRTFVYVVTAAYSMILIRCIYRYVNLFRPPPILVCGLLLTILEIVSPRWLVDGATTSCKTSPRLLSWKACESTLLTPSFPILDALVANSQALA